MTKKELNKLKKDHRDRYKRLNKEGIKVFSLVAEMTVFGKKGIKIYNLNEKI